MGKRLRALALACVLTAGLALALTGCSGSGENYTPESKSPTVTSPTIGQDGTLRVGVDTEKSPLAGMSGSGDKIIGLDVDIAAAIADELGLKLSIVDVGSNPAGALTEGKVDIVMGIDSADAPSGIWLSKQYLPTGIALFSLASANGGVPSKDSSPLVAAQLSSKSAWAVSNEFGDKALKSVSNLPDAFSQLESGSVQYVAADAVIGLYAAHRAGVDVTVSALMAEPSGYCIGVSQANSQLRDAVTNSLSTLSGNGVIGVVESKWLGQPVDFTNVARTAGADKSSEGKAAEEDAKTEGEESDESAAA